MLQAGLLGRINQGEEESGNAALHLAAGAEVDADSLAMAKMLLSHGANPAFTNYRRETPVHFAARDVSNTSNTRACS